ncbi:MAG: YidC/Oxa1 family membrane protein insertase, partial [Staphylococcus warneri]|nr:YidC/Oxa1 family membrane protein insertase [Staphylococcus warneri]
MKKKALLPLFLGLMVFLAGCDYSKPGARSGFFYNTFVDPMKHLLQWLGNDVLHNDYGLAIIILVFVIRLVLLPFMLSNYKNSHMMREKMKVAKPEVDGIQEKV